MTEYETILTEQRDNVLHLTLNRPGSLNAITYQVIEELVSALEACSEDTDVRVVVLSGAGRAFSSGDDLKGMAVQGYPESDDPMEHYRVGYPRVMKALRALKKPTIAKVHGYALGAGCEWVLACDLAVAAEDARLGLVFVQRAIASGTATIARQVPYHQACELLFFGDMLSAHDAQRLGIVNWVVPANQLDAKVDELASGLAQGPTKVIGAIKQAINLGLETSWDEAFEHQFRGGIEAEMTKDSREGRTAFLEKRQPEYKGV